MSQADTASVVVTASEQAKLCEPKNKVTFLSQIVVVFIIITVSLFNLCFQRPDRELWLLLLSSSLGYILPNPSLKFNKPKST